MQMRNKVVWVFFHQYPAVVASYRLSGILPAKYLKIKKAIFLEKDNPLDLLNGLKPDVLIFAKPFHRNAVKLAKEAKNRNIKVIVTNDDWNFVDDTEKMREINNIMTDVAILSDAVVVKTKTAAKIVKKNTGIIPEVISDCLEFETKELINKINYPFELAWFGNSANLDTLLFGLLEIEESNLLVNLTIITNYSDYKDYLYNKINKLNLKNISIKFLEWTLSFYKKLEDVEIVIIPYISDKRRLVKSTSRIIESMNLGKFVITSTMPFNLELKKYCYLGHIGEGLKWVKENQDKALQIAKSGNDYAQKNYKVKKISNCWDQLINKISI
jgi:hypothetical protein